MKKTTKKATKSPRKTTRKSPRRTPKPLAEVFQGECGPATPQVRFDVLCESYNPSEFEGISLATSAVPSVTFPPLKGLEHAKARLPLFDADLTVFDSWCARLDTSLGSYNLGSPKRIERDLRPGSERIRLDFIRLPVIKHVYLKTLTIFDTVGNVVAVQSIGYWMHPGDFVNSFYTLNV
jgi:hypothetical protein